MRLIYCLGVFFLFFASCEKENNSEEVKLIGDFYDKTSIKLPSDKSQLDLNQDKLNFLYGINENLNNEGLNKEIVNSFFVFDSDVLFERKEISEEELALIKDLKALKGKKINKELLDEYVGRSFIYVNERIISNEIKQEYGIDGILSFSRVSFNRENNKAALAIGKSLGKLNGELTLYIFEKNNNEWNPKYYLVLEES